MFFLYRFSFLFLQKSWKSIVSHLKTVRGVPVQIFYFVCVNNTFDNGSGIKRIQSERKMYLKGDDFIMRERPLFIHKNFTPLAKMADTYFTTWPFYIWPTQKTKNLLLLMAYFLLLADILLQYFFTYG